jgi:secretion/DNA translocation related CpaE-like protein
MSHTEDRADRPLVVTADEALLDDLLRLAAAAGTTPEVITDAVSARRAWSTAGIVVLGDDLVGTLASVRPPRRDGVVVAGRADREGPPGGRSHPGATPQGSPTGAAGAPTATASVWPHAVAVGAEDVVWLPDREAELIERFGACLDGVRRGITMAILGGSGGCGASTFAAGLALAAADHELDVLLVDADPLGGGLDLYLGSERPPGMRWSDFASASGRLAAPALREALPRVRGISLLSWGDDDAQPITVESMRSIVAAGQRGYHLVVIDVPRRLDPSAEEALVRADHTLLVLRSDVPGVAAARRLTRHANPLAQRVGVVAVSAGRGGIPGELAADALSLPLTATVRTDHRLPRDLDEGLGLMSRRRGPLTTSCHGVLAHAGLIDGRAA